jgi:hypothetical protein
MSSVEQNGNKLREFERKKKQRKFPEKKKIHLKKITINRNKK